MNRLKELLSADWIQANITICTILALIAIYIWARNRRKSREEYERGPQLVHAPKNHGGIPTSMQRKSTNTPRNDGPTAA